MLLCLFLFLGADEFPVQHVRHSYFVLHDPQAGRERFAAELGRGPAAVWKGGSPIGTFIVLAVSQDQALCRLVSGSHDELDNTCIVRLSEPRIGAEIKGAALPGRSGGMGMTPPPAMADAGGMLTVAALTFRQVGDAYVSERSFPFSRFQNLENLNAFLGQLATEARGRYRFGITSDRLVRENAALFRGFWQDGFYLCLVDGRVGYCHLTADGALSFKSVSVDTLSALADKFFLHVVAYR